MRNPEIQFILIKITGIIWKVINPRRLSCYKWYLSFVRCHLVRGYSLLLFLYVLFTFFSYYYTVVVTTCFNYFNPPSMKRFLLLFDALHIHPFWLLLTPCGCSAGFSTANNLQDIAFFRRTFHGNWNTNLCSSSHLMLSFRC